MSLEKNRFRNLKKKRIFEKERERERVEMSKDDGRTIESTWIHRIKIVTSDVCDSHGNLSLGNLLKWMDATSCMAAERLAKRCCVRRNRSITHSFIIIRV